MLWTAGGGGGLKVQLAVSGARVEPTTYGAQLVLEQSGRKLAYSRLRVTDANGKELPARIEVLGGGYEKESGGRASVLDCGSLLPLSPDPEPTESGRGLPQSKTLRSTAHLAVVVNDAGAVYPVRIDPTFSDANWISMGGMPGADGTVYAAVMDGSGNLYIGGNFTVAGNVVANNIAKWNGSSWSALGSGMRVGLIDRLPSVAALAVSGGTLYAGGDFTTAGGSAANYIAQWNGSSWSAARFGDERHDCVYALAVSGSTLYAGGDFTTAGGNAANYIAQWNGSSWSALGSG